MRLDRLIAERGLVSSRERAQALILAGAVSVDGLVILKASADVPDSAEITVAKPEDQLASRGGLKLEGAFASFDVAVTDRIAVDVGASTGGFTDVLLRRGARRVYAVDVGYGQLAWRLRSDPRVVVMERTNFRTLESFPEFPSLATVDVSFISLRLILPVLGRVMEEDGEGILLIKPQFEVGRGSVGKGGVVRDASLHQSAISSVLECAQELGWSVQGLVASPLLGPAGNREFLAHLRRNSTSALDVPAAIESVVSSLPKARSL